MKPHMHTQHLRLRAITNRHFMALQSVTDTAQILIKENVYLKYFVNWLIGKIIQRMALMHRKWLVK